MTCRSDADTIESLRSELDSAIEDRKQARDDSARAAARVAVLRGEVMSLDAQHAEVSRQLDALRCEYNLERSAHGRLAKVCERERDRAEKAERERDDIASVHEELRALFPERPIVNMIEAVRTLRARVAELEASLAFERATIAELKLEAHQLRVNLHLARARVAELEAAMPTPDEYERIRDAIEGECMDGPNARREYIGGAWSWVERMDAERAKGGQ
jgi:predicted S18 family serine protease